MRLKIVTMSLSVILLGIAVIAIVRSPDRPSAKIDDGCPKCGMPMSFESHFISRGVAYNHYWFKCGTDIRIAKDQERVFRSNKCRRLAE